MSAENPVPTYGVTPPSETAHLSGKEILQAMIDGKLPQPPIAKALTFLVSAVGDGFAAFEGEPGPHLLNALGTVHGGWALTLIDSAAGCAGFTTLPAGTSYTTIETKGNFSRPITPTTGRVRAEGRVVSKGKRIISAEATIKDREGRVLGHGTSTLLVLPGE